MSCVCVRQQQVRRLPRGVRVARRQHQRGRARAELVGLRVSAFVSARAMQAWKPSRMHRCATAAYHRRRRRRRRYHRRRRRHRRCTRCFAVSLAQIVVVCGCCAWPGQQSISHLVVVHCRRCRSKPPAGSNDLHPTKMKKEKGTICPGVAGPAACVRAPPPAARNRCCCSPGTKSERWRTARRTSTASLAKT